MTVHTSCMEEPALKTFSLLPRMEARASVTVRVTRRMWGWHHSPRH